MTLIRFPHSDILGSKLAWQLPEAYRSLLRPSSVTCVKASFMCAWVTFYAQHSKWKLSDSWCLMIGLDHQTVFVQLTSYWWQPITAVCPYLLKPKRILEVCHICFNFKFLSYKTRLGASIKAFHPLLGPWVYVWILACKSFDSPDSDLNSS